MAQKNVAFFVAFRYNIDVDQSFIKKGDIIMAVSGKTYHVSKNSDGKWQVKAAGAQKALKLFNTQKEASAYAETVYENQDGNIAIHKKDGKLRKQTY